LIINYILESQLSESSQSQTGSQSNIQDFLLATRAKKRPQDIFEIEKFKELVLNFILSNNLSFRTVSSQSYKTLLNYLRE
jgi:hypothetical protein